MSAFRLSTVKLPGTFDRSSSIFFQSTLPISESFRMAAISWLICRKAMFEKVRVLFVTTLSNCMHRFLVSSHIFIR